MTPIRVGKISSINYEEGTAKVVYSDRDNSVTNDIPFFSMEYNMPKIGDQVVVIHLSKGEEMAFILGKVWSSKRKPYAPIKGVYRKEYAETDNEAVITYDNEKRVLKIRAPKMECEIYEEGETVAIIPKLIEHDEEIEALHKKDQELEEVDRRLDERLKVVEGMLGVSS